RCSFLLQLHKRAEDTGTTFCSPWLGSSRPSTPSRPSAKPHSKTWVAGASPARGISGCIERHKQPWFAQPDSRGSIPAMTASRCLHLISTPAMSTGGRGDGPVHVAADPLCGRHPVHPEPDHFYRGAADGRPGDL